jgi:hypothetical protein
MTREAANGTAVAHAQVDVGVHAAHDEAVDASDTVDHVSRPRHHSDHAAEAREKRLLEA